MKAGNLILGILVVLAILSSAVSAQYCNTNTFTCVGGQGNGKPCTLSSECYFPPIESKTAETSSGVSSLYADIALGVMGVAIAAIITLVGFTIYAKGATTKVAKTAKKTKRRRR